MNLRTRLIRAGVWTAGAHSLEMATRLLSNLILTRLLFPEAFGLVAASSSLMIGLALISDFGIRAVVIRSPRGDTDSFLWSAWVFQISRGITLWLILTACCGILSLPPVRELIPAGSVFSHPSFPLLTILLGLQLLFSGLESTAIALNLRRLNYQSVIFVDLAAKIIPVPIMVICAWLSSSVWALAIGALTGSLLRLVLSHTIVPGPRMRWVWKKDQIQEIVQFGKWITISSVATFIGSQSDVILFGVLFPSSFVGVYFISKTLVDAVEGLLEKINSTLTLPVLGEVLRQNPDNLRDRFYRFRLPIDILAAGVGGFLFSAGDQIVRVLYDPRYDEAGAILQILGLSLALYPLQLIRSAFTAIGRTNIVAIVSLIHAISVVILIFTGYAISGSSGAVMGLALSRLFPSAVIILLARQYKWTSGWRELRIIPLFFVGVLAGQLALMLAKSTPWLSPHLFR